MAERGEKGLGVEVPSGCGDDDDLARLSQDLPGTVQRVRPSLVVFQAGVDPGFWDRLTRTLKSIAV